MKVFSFFLLFLLFLLISVVNKLFFKKKIQICLFYSFFLWLGILNSNNKKKHNKKKEIKKAQFNLTKQTV